MIRAKRFGMRVFETVGEATLAGYQIYHQTEDGTVLRKRTKTGEWFFAMVPKAHIPATE